MEEKKIIHYYVKNKDLMEEIRKYKLTVKYNEKGKAIQGSGKVSDTLRSNDC